MVYYIRFFKTPKLENGTIRALITITTDLGDSFYPGNLTIHALITENTTDNLPLWKSEWRTVQWKAGNRNVWIEVKGVPSTKERRFQLIVNSKKTKEADNVSLSDLPEIVSARSDHFGRDTPQAGNLVERRYRTESGYERSLYEESGESIARHIWDAGIALVAYLCNVVKQEKPTALLAKIQSRPCLRVLELGTGCGIVGLNTRYLCPASNVFLTDLPEAMEILNYNAQPVRSYTEEGYLGTMELDWEVPLPERLKESPMDIILVSDCTYNSDSIPALVKTLAAFVEASPIALVVVSMKVRHDSEAIFFDLMSDAGLISVEHTAIPLPDRLRLDTGQQLEVVDIYVYAKEQEDRVQLRDH